VSGCDFSRSISRAESVRALAPGGMDTPAKIVLQQPATYLAVHLWVTVVDTRRALVSDLALPSAPLVFRHPHLSPCNRSGSTVESGTLAAIAAAECTSFGLAVRFHVRLHPKVPRLLIRVWCISGRALPFRFLVELGA